uniref:Uncharacterized protein n=1 Tax=Parascaris univalens TaxID=6257 RepID=A0A915BT62_PARUN
MKKKKSHNLPKERKKKIIVTDIGGKKRCILTEFEHPTKDDNPLAKATPSLVEIAPQSILIKTHKKISTESPMKIDKEIEAIFEKRDQQADLIEPETARETEETTARLIELDNGREIQKKTTHPLELETARETEETTAWLIEPETARETEETTACLPDKEPYRKFKERLKGLRRTGSMHIDSPIQTAKSLSTTDATTARSGTFSEMRFTSSSAINRQRNIIVSTKNEKRRHRKKAIIAKRNVRTKAKSRIREKAEKHHRRHEYSTLKKRDDNVIELKTAYEGITSTDANVPVRGKPKIEAEVHKSARICEDEFGNPIKITLEELSKMEVIAEEELQKEEDKKAREETKKIVVTMETIQVEERKLPQQKKEPITEVSVKELKRVVKVELNEEEVVLQHTQGEENDMLTDRTISEKSEDDVTAALDDSPTDSTAANDSEIALKTIHSMDRKIYGKK